MKSVTLFLVMALLCLSYSKNTDEIVDNECYSAYLDEVTVTPKLERYASEEDFLYMAKLINAASANQSFSGQLAVGQIVMNRTKYYGLSVKDVIFAKGQFSEIRSKYFKRNLNEIPESVKLAAKQVLCGRKVIPENYIFYYAHKLVDNRWTKRISKHSLVIQDHTFCKQLRPPKA